VQDDPDDWAREAGLMSWVYRNARMTLAADRATNLDAGFLFCETWEERCPYYHTHSPSSLSATNMGPSSSSVLERRSRIILDLCLERVF